MNNWNWEFDEPSKKKDEKIQTKNFDIMNELRKRKDETIETDNLVNLRNKELNHLDETRIRITLCVSFIN